MTDFHRKFCAARDAEAEAYDVQMSEYGEWGFKAGADWAIKFLMQSSEMGKVKEDLLFLSAWNLREAEKVDYWEWIAHKTCAENLAENAKVAREALATIRAMEGGEA